MFSVKKYIPACCFFLQMMLELGSSQLGPRLIIGWCCPPRLVLGLVAEHPQSTQVEKPTLSCNQVGY
jgi:hypothetical protein